MTDPELKAYIEREIIPQYDNFDKAHRRDHVRMVIDQSLKIALNYPELDTDMVYAIAAFHDLGLTNGRENHHRDSKSILKADSFLRTKFTPSQIETMGNAVEDHRASSANRPRTLYGLVVAEADRFIDTETIIRRTVQYGLNHYPELDREGHYRRTVSHLHEKYGPQGYLKIWIPGSENERRLKELHRVIADETALRTIFERIFAEETAEE